ncbi:MAG: hypothetical protein ACOX2F_00690 [bacterium]
MNRIKFLSITLVFTVSLLFLIKFALYPVSSFFLHFYGIKYDFSTIDYESDYKIAIEDFVLEIDNVVNFKAGKIVFSVGRKSVNFLKKSICSATLR